MKTLAIELLLTKILVELVKLNKDPELMTPLEAEIKHNAKRLKERTI